MLKVWPTTYLFDKVNDKMFAAAAKRNQLETSGGRSSKQYMECNAIFFEDNVLIVRWVASSAPATIPCVVCLAENRLIPVELCVPFAECV